MTVERLVLLEVVEQRLLGLARAGQDPFLCSAQRVDDAVEEVEIGGRAAGTDDARLVMHLAEGHVRPEPLLFDVLGIKPEDVRLAAVHPDDGAAMGHRYAPRDWLSARLACGCFEMLIWIKWQGRRPCSALRRDMA